MIRVKIDVTKIDKERLFRGQKGIYCDITLIETPNDQYGNDYVAVQDLGKEAREAGEKGAILGNAKAFGQAPKPAAAPDHDNVRANVLGMLSIFCRLTMSDTDKETPEDGARLAPRTCSAGFEHSGVWCCTEKSQCKWQGFALHQGLAWGTANGTPPAWRDRHNANCRGRLIQLILPNA